MMTLMQHALLKLSEECNEVGQMASKCMQFGMNEEYDDFGPNVKRLHDELNDLNAVVQLLNEEFNLRYVPNRNDMDNKKRKIKQYLEYSQSLNMVENQTWESVK